MYRLFLNSENKCLFDISIMLSQCFPNPYSVFYRIPALTKDIYSTILHFLCMTGLNSFII